MSPKAAVAPAPEPSPLDVFAEIHQHRAQIKSRAHSRDDKRLYHLTPIPPRVLETRKLTIDPPFNRLAIDERYQRLEMAGWVNDLSALLRRGGETPPIDVAYREWEAGEKLWIVDGQQRYWAHWDCNRPIACLVHNVRSLQEEKDLFEALNNRRRVGPNLTIHNHGGAAAAMLREANDAPAHPLYQRVHFKATQPGSHIAASSILTATARYCGVVRGSSITAQLVGVDRFIAAGGKGSVAAFLTVIGNVYPAPQRPTADMLYALGRGINAAKANASTITKPTLTRLRHTHLDRVKAATKRERITLMAARVERAISGKTTLLTDES